MYQITTALKKIKRMKAKKKGVQGGTSASKTVSILIILIDRCTREKGLEVSVVSESVPHLKKGALKDFIKIMKKTGRWNEARYNATDRVYRFATDSYMEFFSPEAILGARRNVLYVNEANNIGYEDFHQLSIRTSDDIYLDWNPSNEFWWHKEVMNDTNAETIILNYLDNEALPGNVLGEFEQARMKADREKDRGIDGYWTNWCKVYIDGQVGSLQGACIKDFTIIPNVPPEAKLFRRGLDFGYSNDPMAGCSVYLWNGGRIFDEFLYRTHMGISELVSIVKPLNDCDLMCDNSNPLMIQELQRAGIKAKPCIKGKDSIEYGLEVINQLPVYITERSLNMIKEARNYVIDPITNKPIDRFNHLWDAGRYAAVEDPKPAIKTVARTH